MDFAATAAFPVAESGRMRPALTWPVPILVVGCAGALAGELDSRSLTEKLPEQPAVSSAAPMTAATQRNTRAKPSRGTCNTRYIRAGLLDSSHDVTVYRRLQQTFAGSMANSPRGKDRKRHGSTSISDASRRRAVRGRLKPAPITKAATSNDGAKSFHYTAAR